MVQPPGERQPAPQASRAVDGGVIERETLAGRPLPPPHGADIATVERVDESGEPLPPESESDQQRPRGAPAEKGQRRDEMVHALLKDELPEIPDQMTLER